MVLSRRWLTALLLGAAGLALNLLAVPLLPGLQLLFGAVPVFVVAVAYGPGPGALAGAIAGVRAAFLWGHPYGWLLLVLEATAVGALRRRMRPSFAVGLYWLALGFWLGMGSYGLLLHVPWFTTTIAILKQALNGLVNGLLAEALLLPFPIRRALRLQARPTVRAYLGVLAALAAAIPLLTVWVLGTRQQVAAGLEAGEMEARTTATLLAHGIEPGPGGAATLPGPAELAALRLPGLELGLRTPSGTVLAVGRGGRLAVQPEGDRDPGAAAALEVLAGGREGTGSYARPGPAAVPFMRTYRLVMVSAQRAGTSGWIVWSELPYENILAPLSRRVLTGEVALIAALLVALSLALAIARQLERPIAALARAADRFAAGDLDARVESAALTAAPAEPVLLAARLDAMATRLQLAEAERARLLASERAARGDAELRRDELERVMESRTRLMRGFTHDVKNPLGAADGYLQLLGDGVLGELSAKQHDSVAQVRRAIHAALALIDDLVELARAEAGQLDIQPRVLDVADIATELVAEYRAQVEAAGLSIELRTDSGSPLHSDPRRIRQVLGNLLSNAVKYTPAGGRISVSVRPVEGEPAAVDGGVAIDVADTGQGIAPERHELIFREFSRLEPGRTPGAGLGLAISRRVALALGGDLTFVSAPGAGSTFTLWLPPHAPAPD